MSINKDDIININIKYCLMNIEKGCYNSMHNCIGTYYYNQKDYDNMKKYYLMAIEKGNDSSMYNLGTYYYEQKDYDNMKKYYLMAKEKGNKYKNTILEQLEQLEQFEIAKKLLSLRSFKKE